MKHLLENYEEIDRWHRLPFYKKWFTDKPIKKLISDRCNEYRAGRRAGNTTRVANIIEELLTTKSARIEDHFQSSRASEMLLDIVLRRLDNEHGIYIKDMDIQKIINRASFNTHNYYILTIK